MGFDIPVTPVERKIGEALHAASIYFGTPITREQVMSKSKSKQHVRPRQWCMAYLRWKYPEISFPRIARMFGKKDHTTVISAVRRARARYPDAIFVTGVNDAMRDRLDALGLAS